MLRIAHLSSFDQHQGAAKAAWRLHDALRDEGHSSTMFVANKKSNDGDVIELNKLSFWARKWRGLMLRLNRTHSLSQSTTDNWFDANLTSEYQWKQLKHLQIDVLLVHLTRAFLPAKAIGEIIQATQALVLLIPVDISTLSGGCHHHFNCLGFTKQCGECPQLRHSHELDWSHNTYKEKHRWLTNKSIHLIAATTWVADRIEESSLYRNHSYSNIPLSIDTSLYYFGAKNSARDDLGLEQNRLIIMFGAHSVSDPRKGMKYLVAALKILSENLSEKERAKICLCVVGANGDDMLDELDFEIKDFGYVKEHALAKIYMAADVFACPSVYDAGPMMIPEAMMCGTPVVAFDSGGAPDIVKTYRNGYLAEASNAKALAQGLEYVLFDATLEELSTQAAQDAMDRHSPDVVAGQYTRLLEQLQAEC